jgi:hypothetical protein
MSAFSAALTWRDYGELVRVTTRKPRLASLGTLAGFPAREEIYRAA